ncbi:single-strand DNA endonuclease 1-like isoform X2 [Zingiber officinale]|uniref:single-strand DNA endonuclease 1-like isoform X2 n=1 Tax=Zingiber officinale TaxID=94328 RepID=UPI001C4D0D79|nr:single-strand DNA endonuclease 1-like isoform X2 [Zingiber officinale]
MGVKNLWDILESCKKILPLHHLQNKKLCVDLSCWLVQLQNSCRTPAGIKEKVYLKNLFHRLRALVALNCSLILVADGAIPSMKLSTYRSRLGFHKVMQEDANSNATSSISICRNKGSEFSCMIKEAKFLGTTLGIPFLDGLEEAEAQCASLNMEYLCDGCFSSDSDIFLFGARTVYRDIFLGETGYVICYEMKDIEQKLGFGRNSLISLALLLGCDYSQGIHGFGPESACRIVKSLGDDSVLHQIISVALNMERRCQRGKKITKNDCCNVNKENEHENWQNVEPDHQYVEVVNAYLRPKCYPPDSEAVRRVCIDIPFQRTQFQHLCEQYFGWSPDQTDHYILPKIAERDLRRFANLRSTSSGLGARIPLHEMPVSCPVSAIIKQRKVQGQEYYEVSWQRRDGLCNSIIPADLIISACPEKLAEFMGRKAEVKKETVRPRKSSKATANGLHEPAANARKPRKLNKDAISKINFQLQGLLLDIERESRALPEPVNCFLETNSENVIPELIDLCSPSPLPSSFKAAKSLKSTDLHVDIIDICQSENEASSPEHEKKARELRSFINTIRKDLY